MSLLSESLTVWEVAFRWAGYNPRKIWFRIPLEVQDHFRNLMDAILKAELSCETITLEKRKFGSDEPIEFSIYHWLDNINSCIGGFKYNRKMLRWALLGRYDLMLWCERWNISPPEFWFPSGGNLEYRCPEDEYLPGYRFYHKYHANMDLQNGQDSEKPSPDSQEVDEDPPVEIAAEPDFQNSTTVAHGAADKLRPVQRVRAACQQIAISLWKQFPDMNITAMVKHEAIQTLGGGSCCVQEVVHRWLSEVAPNGIKGKRGRPRKNNSTEQ